MLGAIIGDIVGSVYEFNNIKSKDFPLLTNTSHITDDTICTVAVADALIHQKPIQKTLQEWCRRHPVGYAKRFQEWIDSPNPSPYQSWGNGAVMRISPVGLIHNRLEKAIEIGHKITQITHDHPDSFKAVDAYLTTMFLLKEKQKTPYIKSVLASEFSYDMNRNVDDIRATYDKFYVRCSKTVPEAIICALDATSFEDAIRNAVSLGGDSDTLACMAGALAELRFGVPKDIKQKAWTYLSPDMKVVLTQLYREPEKMTTHPHMIPNADTQREKSE